MYFSVGILYSAIEFIKLIRKYQITDECFLSTYNRFNVADADIVLNCCINYNWVTVSSKNQLVLTSSGENIASLSHTVAQLRVILLYMISLDKPLWASNFHLGRLEAVNFLPTDVKQCIKEANLISGYDMEIIEWWDNASYNAFNSFEYAKLKQGRKAEYLSLQYEYNRIGKTPIWKSIDSNLAGYDLISNKSQENNELLMIEVKSCSSTININFYLSANEWETAQLIPNYIFHIWHFANAKNTLYILDKDFISPHIPLNVGTGTWENCILNFSTADLLSREANLN